MLDAGVLVGSIALVALMWNLTRINDVMKAWKVECWEKNDPIAYCMENGFESQTRQPPTSSDGDEQETAEEMEDGPEPTKEDIARFKEAKRREHFEGMVPGSLTPYPWRPIYHGRGRPSCVRRRSSLSTSGYNMIG